MWSRFSCVRLFLTPWTVAHQAPLSMGFSRQERWSEFPCPPLARWVPEPKNKGKENIYIYYTKIHQTVLGLHVIEKKITQFKNHYTIRSSIEAFWKNRRTAKRNKILEAYRTVDGKNIKLLFKDLTFPGCTRGKEPACQCRRYKRCWFDPWVGNKIKNK